MFQRKEEPYPKVRWLDISVLEARTKMLEKGNTEDPSYSEVVCGI